jgi:hypothetical protein
MKKILFSIVILVMFCTGTPATLGQARGGAEAARGKDLRREYIKADPNDPLNRAKAMEVRNRERERERLEKVRQDRLKAREQRNKERRESRLSGGNHQQRLEAFEKQLAQEEQKHLKRRARLKRIRELAVQQNAEETLARVDRLIEKEKKRYDSKRNRVERHMNTIKRMQDRQKSGQPTPKSSGRQEPARPTTRGYRPAPKRPPTVKPSIPVEKKAESNDL